MKIYLCSLVAMLSILFSGATKSQCAQGLPPTTGLGQCVDFVLAASDMLTMQTQQALGEDWTFHWGTSNYTDYTLKRVYATQYDCNSGSTNDLYRSASIIAHELGHVGYGNQEDTSSRDSYIQSWCDNEGAAAINNILGRNEIKACSMNAIDIGIMAANPVELQSVYAAGGDVVRNVGDAFCDNNTTNGKNYRDYYGDYYDANY